VRIHLLANVARPDAIEAAHKAATWLCERGVTVGVDTDLAAQTGLEEVVESDLGVADLVVSFGGDGTLIRAAHLCSETGTPVLGVYYGRFGFVTQCTAADLGSCLSDFFDGKAKIESRMMLQTDLLRGGQVVATIHSLNEMVLQRSVTMPMMTFSIVVDGHDLTQYPADGVMVSTPTGSTAYNLSAGGPIMDPRVQALIMTALAPHTLSARTLVLHADSEIVLRLEARGDAVLSADGQTRLHLLSGDEVRVARSPRVTKLICVEKDDFLIKLGDRLFWSRGMHGGHS
jgi:NAD+ kinase